MGKYETLTDKDLAKLAKRFKVDITDGMTREDVERVVELAEGSMLPGTDQTNNANITEGEKNILKNGRDVIIQFMGKGTIKYKGEWIGLVIKQVSAELADELMTRFPGRFRMLGRA